MWWSRRPIIEDQIGPFTNDPQPLAHDNEIDDADDSNDDREDPSGTHKVHPQQKPTTLAPIKPGKQTEKASPVKTGVQTRLAAAGIDREAITKFINEKSLLTYMVRSVRISSYLKSLLDLASLLTRENLYTSALDEVRADVVQKIRQYIEDLHKSGKYDQLASQVLSYKLSMSIFDVFGEVLGKSYVHDLYAAGDSDLDRQLRATDARLSSFGFPIYYGHAYYDDDNPSAYKIDCILFAADDDCIGELNRYAQEKFHYLNDKYRKYIVGKSEKCKKLYSDIIADGDKVSKHNFTLPEIINVKVDKDGKEYDNHLFADEEGIAKIKLNGWEEGVLAEEEKSADFVCWLRNPPREKWSLCIPYEVGGEIKSAYPDFLIVRSDPQLDFVIDILEPHSPDFKDNLGKAKGFASYAENEPSIGRVQIIRTGKDAAGKTRFKRLDLSLGAVREKVLKAQNNDELDHIFDVDGIF